MTTAIYTLAQLQAMPVTGSFLTDEALWIACEDFILDESQTDTDRIAAVRIIDAITGVAPAGPETLADIVASIEDARS